MIKKIAVTGAAGHVGNVVCRTLLDRGYSVRALCRGDVRALEGLPLEMVQGDVLNVPDLDRLVAGCDAVIHCAAIISINGDPDGRVHRTNTLGPVLVLAAAAKAGLKKMVHISSVHAVMEIPWGKRYDETRPYKKEGSFAYDYSKARGEQKLLEEAQHPDMELVIVRPSSVIGPWDFKPSEMGKALIDFYRQKIPVLPPGGYDFVDVRDVAASIVSALEKGKNREIYLLSGKYYPMRSLAAIIEKVSGKRTPRRSLPFVLLKSMLPMIALYSRISRSAPLYTLESITALKHGHPNMDHSKADRQLGHRCRPIEDTIRDFYAWSASIHIL